LGENNRKVIVGILIISTLLWLLLLFYGISDLFFLGIPLVVSGVILGTIGSILGILELGAVKKDFKIRISFNVPEQIKSKMKTAKQKTLILSIIIWIILVTLYVPIYYDWSQKSLNDEIGVTSLPNYDDENTTLVVQIMDQGIVPGTYTESDSEIITSEHALRIRIDYKWNSLLNICYVEILVYNGTAVDSLEGWSLNITAGNPEGTSAGTQEITIPPQASNREVTFKVKLWSTAWNETSRTDTLLNNMEFSYTVYYSNSEINIDRIERINTRNFLLLDILLVSLWIILLCYVPSNMIKEDSIKMGTTPRGLANWAKYIGSRIDNLDQTRHNLILQTQFLVTILSIIANFSADRQFESQIIPIIVILSFPLIVSILILMAGPRVINVERIVSADSKTSINALIEDLKIKSDFLQRVKSFVGASSMYAVAIVLFFSIPQNPKYELIWVYSTYFMFIIFCLLNLYIIGLITYRKFAYPNQDVEAFEE